MNTSSTVTTVDTPSEADAGEIYNLLLEALTSCSEHQLDCVLGMEDEGVNELVVDKMDTLLEMMTAMKSLLLSLLSSLTSTQKIE